MLGVRCFELCPGLRDPVDGKLLTTAVRSFRPVQGLVVDHAGLAEAPMRQVALPGYDGVEADGVGGMS